MMIAIRTPIQNSSGHPFVHPVFTNVGIMISIMCYSYSFKVIVEYRQVLYAVRHAHNMVLDDSVMVLDDSVIIPDDLPAMLLHAPCDDDSHSVFPPS